ncbi:MAG TPA: hypothetical protein VHT34_11710 [Clostridia bacterium]|nr:hypothetical protein [Clostridia bacterium]
MRIKKTAALFLVLSLLLSIGSFASGTTAADTIKYKTVKLSYGAEFSIPADWEQINSPSCTEFRRTKAATEEDFTHIFIMSSKQGKAKYKSLEDFAKANTYYGKTKDANNVKVTTIKANCSSTAIVDTTFTRVVDLGGWGGIFRIEAAFFKTKSGNYFGVQFITSDFNLKTGASKLDKIVPTIIKSFKDVKPTATKPATPAVAKSTRLFPVSLDGVFSYVDINGKAVLKTDYGFADDFVNGYAHIMNELGGMSGYMDSKGKQLSAANSVNVSKANLNIRGAREIKGNIVVDLSKKVKKYTSTHDGWKANNEDYNISDGFEVRIWTASGAPCVRLYKNGKIICDKIKQLEGQDIFLIVKYDNEKIIRFLYADASTGKLKTLYVDYNGNPIWTKTAQAGLTSATKTTTKPQTPAKTEVEGLTIVNRLAQDAKYLYVGFNLDGNLSDKAEKAVGAMDAAIQKRTGGNLTHEQKVQILSELNKGSALGNASFQFVVNNVKLTVSLFKNTNDPAAKLKDININVVID